MCIISLKEFLMSDNSMLTKLNELKKIIKDTSANCGDDELTEFILLTAMVEIKLRNVPKEGLGNERRKDYAAIPNQEIGNEWLDSIYISELEMKIDQAIVKLNSKQE